MTEVNLDETKPVRAVGFYLHDWAKKILGQRDDDDVLRDRVGIVINTTDNGDKGWLIVSVDLSEPADENRGKSAHVGT